MNTEDENLIENENNFVEEEFAVSENMQDNKILIVTIFIICILFIFSFVAEYVSYIDELQVEEEAIDKTGVLDNYKKDEVFEEFLQSQEKIKSENSNNSQNKENKKIKKYVIEPRGYYNLPNDLRIKVTIETDDDINLYDLNITPQIPGTPFGFLSQEF